MTSRLIAAMMLTGMMAACQGSPGAPPAATSTQPAQSAPAARVDGAQAPPPTAIPVDPSVNELLDRIEKSAADLNSFTAKIVYQKEDAVLGRKETRTGERSPVL